MYRVKFFFDHKVSALICALISVNQRELFKKFLADKRRLVTRIYAHYSLNP
jgi:hypothetical protein